MNENAPAAGGSSPILFDLGHWHAIIIVALSKFRAMAGFAQDEEARRTHLQLILVYIMAVVERILDEFFVTSFRTHPEWMHEYLRAGAGSDIKGMLSLRDVVSSGSREELIQKLARRATDTANSGSFHERLKRVEKLSGHTIYEQQKHAVAALSERRNRLVHELRFDPVSEDEVEAAFELALELLEALGHAAKRSSVPYDDPSYLLGNPVDAFSED